MIEGMDGVEEEEDMEEGEFRSWEIQQFIDKELRYYSNIIQ